MKILVTGATGNVGGDVVRRLHKRGVEVRALARTPEKANLPDGIEVFKGDQTDPDSIRNAAKGVDKLFLLNGNVPDELTQALTTLGIARQAGIKHVAYLSVYKADHFADVPHFAAKVAVENALAEYEVPHTILRPGYFFQNELGLKSLLTQVGIYPMPIGLDGISAIDTGDVAEAAAIALTEQGHDGQTYDVVSSSQLSGPSSAALWSKALNKQIMYTGHDFDAWEAQMKAQIPAWLAYDMRAMFQGYVERGFSSGEAEVRRITHLLGRAPRTYEDFIAQTSAEWTADEKR